MVKTKEKIPWFAQLTPKKMYPEWEDINIKRDDEGWDRETHKEYMAELLDKYGFRFRNDNDTLYEATKIWELRYSKNDIYE